MATFRIAYAAFDVPLSTMTALLPRDAVERERYVRVRMVAAATTRLLVTGVNAYLVTWAADRIATIGLTAICLLSVTLILCSAALLIAVARTSPVAVASTACPGGERCRISVPSLRSLLAAFVIATAILPTLSRLLIFVGDSGTNASGPFLLCAFSFGSVFGPFALKPVQRAIRDASPVTPVAVLACLSSLALGLAIAAGGLIEMIVGALLHGVVLGMVGTLLWIRTVSLAAKKENGVRKDSFVIGAVTACTQVSVAIGTLALAPFIDGVAQVDNVTLAGASGVSALGALILTLGPSDKKSLTRDGRAAEVPFFFPPVEAEVRGAPSLFFHPD